MKRTAFSTMARVWPFELRSFLLQSAAVGDSLQLHLVCWTRGACLPMVGDQHHDLCSRSDRRFPRKSIRIWTHWSLWARPHAFAQQAVGSDHPQRWILGRKKRGGGGVTNLFFVSCSSFGAGGGGGGLQRPAFFRYPSCVVWLGFDVYLNPFLQVYETLAEKPQNPTTPRTR